MPWVVGGIAGFSAALLVVWHGAWRQQRHDRVVMAVLFAAIGLLSVAIALRWLRVGYGPFLTLFEILLSNLFSLGLVYAVLFWRLPQLRPGASVVLPVLVLLGVWMTSVPTEPGQLPATYETAWLWIHVGVGKIFLGLCLAATGLAAALLLEGVFHSAGRLTGQTDVAALDALVWRLLSIAFVFQSLMLIAGAVWAHDAWGHYWTWDPLETWAFITWLALGLSLHARLTWRLPDWAGWLMAQVVFCLAFLTFFGLPFGSLGPHKGVM